MTPEEIQRAHELAAYAPKMGYALVDTEAALLARAVLALTEQAELDRARMQRVDGYMVEWRTKARDLKAELAKRRTVTPEQIEAEARLNAELQGAYAHISKLEHELADWKRGYGKTFNRLAEIETDPGLSVDGAE